MSAAPYGVGEIVQRVAWHAIAPFGTRLCEHLDHDVSYSLCHLNFLKGRVITLD
jgi:hypothetical protein